jgi:hypothetical protein
MKESLDRLWAHTYEGAVLRYLKSWIAIPYCQEIRTGWKGTLFPLSDVYDVKRVRAGQYLGEGQPAGRARQPARVSVAADKLDGRKT